MAKSTDREANGKGKEKVVEPASKEEVEDPAPSVEEKKGRTRGRRQVFVEVTRTRPAPATKKVSSRSAGRKAVTAEAVIDEKEQGEFLSVFVCRKKPSFNILFSRPKKTRFCRRVTMIVEYLRKIFLTKRIIVELKVNHLPTVTLLGEDLKKFYFTVPATSSLPQPNQQLLETEPQNSTDAAEAQDDSVLAISKVEGMLYLFHPSRPTI